MGINKTKKRKFNVMDAIILVLIVAVIAVVAVFAGLRSTGAVTDVKETGIEYVVEFRQIREEFADNFKEGTLVSDAVAKYQLGEVVAVNVENATYSSNDLKTNELVISDYPEHINVQLTIKATATFNEQGLYYLGGGYQLSVGSTVHVRTPDFTGTGYCIEMKKTEA